MTQYADTREISKVVKTLQKCGEGLVLAKIGYGKSGENWVTERLVEPYQFTFSGPNIIVLTWQCDPVLDQPAWRNFRVDKIKMAEATTKPFYPRQQITLQTGVATQFDIDAEPQSTAQSKPSHQQVYMQALTKALDDFDLTTRETSELLKLQKPLGEQQLRAAHGRIYADILADFCADGRLTRDEQEKLTAMRIWLNELGWSP